MTDATYRDQDGQQHFYQRIHTIFEEPEYADNRPTRRNNDAAGNPYPWRPGHTLAVLGMIAFGLLAIGLIGFSASDVCITNGCEVRLAKKLELMEKQTDADIKRADIKLDVEKTRIDADKAIRLAESTDRRAAANSDANARAGFGNNDDSTKQSAVAPARVIAPPNRVVLPPVVTPAPVVGCGTCGNGFHAMIAPRGEIGTCANGQQTNRPKPINGAWEPKVNPRSGQCTWWNAQGLVPQYR